MNIYNQHSSSIEIYCSLEGGIELNVKLENDTVWLTQSQTAELFDKDQSIIARHIKNAITDSEINEKSNMEILHITQYSGSLVTYTAGMESPLLKFLVFSDIR